MARAAAVAIRSTHDTTGDGGPSRCDRTIVPPDRSDLPNQPGSSGSGTCDLVAGGRHHVPLGAERVHVLAPDLAWLARVVGVVVQRVVVVRHLRGVVT